MIIIPSDTTPTRADLLDEIARQRDRVLALDGRVLELGAELDRATEERDRAVAHLQHLIEWAEQQVAA